MFSNYLKTFKKSKGLERG